MVFVNAYNLHLKNLPVYITCHLNSRGMSKAPTLHVGFGTSPPHNFSNDGVPEYKNKTTIKYCNIEIINNFPLRGNTKLNVLCQ